ncbi:MAG: hypothetical protein FWH15_08140 [Betaproteobacteria bacterium]|nr:hypothetical protein [Betaproteobacteria bacterium]
MRFVYKAVDGAGFTHKGTLDAETETDALQQLFERGYTPISPRAESVTQTEGVRSHSAAIRHADVIALIRELATLLKSGVGISDAFLTLQDFTKPCSVALWR